MSVIVSTDDFINLIKAAKVTSYNKADDPTLICAHLHTVSADGPEAGTVTKLVATSTDGIVSGQYAVEAEGALDSPILLDLTATKWLIDMLGTARKKMKAEAGNQAEFTVELKVVADSAGGPGALEVQTLTDGVVGQFDTKGNPPLAEADDFPYVTVLRELRGIKRNQVRNDDGEDVQDGPAVAVDKAQIDVEKGITAVFGEPVIRYPLGHTANRRALTCGEWIGSVPGTLVPGHADPDNPDVPVFAIDGATEYTDDENAEQDDGAAEIAGD